MTSQPLQYSFTPDTEATARRMCEVQDIDPEKTCYSMGCMMPKDVSYPAWVWQATLLEKAGVCCSVQANCTGQTVYVQKPVEVRQS